MKIIETAVKSMWGPKRESMQDASCIKQLPDGTFYLGVFDGHGEHGRTVAKTAATIMCETASHDRRHNPNALKRVARVADQLKAFHDSIPDCDLTPNGGTTATIGSFVNNKIAVAYLGDTEAVFYPDDGDLINLTIPHNVHNANEVARVSAIEGISVLGNRFSEKADRMIKEIAISRAIGDWYFSDFILHDAEFGEIDTDSTGPGTLVIASDGVWGRSNHVEVGVIAKSSETVAEAAAIITREFSAKTGDDATAIVARIQ